MQRILSECAAFQTKLADAHAANDARRAEVEKLRTEVLAVGDQLKCFTPGSRNHAECLHRLYEMLGDLVTAEKTAQYECDRAEVAVYEEFHRRVENEVDMYARRNNIALVLNRTTPVLSTTTIDEAQALFGRRVAYEHDVDITDEILARLIPPKNCIAIPRAD